MTYPQYWTCPQCKSVVSNSNHCTNCAYQPQVQQKQGYPDYWACPKCGSTVSNSPACTTCQYNPSVTRTITKEAKPDLMNILKNSKLILVGGIVGILLLGTVLVLNIVNSTVAPELVESRAEQQMQSITEKVAFLKECKPEWVCDDWIPCEEKDLVQERNCEDINECNTDYLKPMTMRMC